MTDKMVITAEKGIRITEAEADMIREELVVGYQTAKRTIEERWGVSITLEVA